MSSSRRKFIQKLGATTLLATAGSLQGISAPEYIEQRKLLVQKRTTANDKVRVGFIGMGIMGFRNVKTVLQIPGVELAAFCDLYTGRLQHAAELYGKEIFSTQDYQAVLSRKDIDAVVISTSDQWHDLITIAAMRAGKAVYCEKPMVHKLDQGLEVIRVQQETKAKLQVGSQRVSSIAYAKAKEYYKAGEIGQINCIEASFDRHTAFGAWQYTMPLDASEQTVAWKKYLKDNSGTPFDPVRFFRWRNYREYGTGVAGDLFVHLLSGIHFMTDSKGPSRIYATGELSYWKDGRNVPDVMTGVLEYAATPEHPAFQVLLKANLASGAEKVEYGKVKIYGTEGVIDFGWNDFTLRRNKFMKAPGLGGWDAYETYTTAMQEKITADYAARYPKEEISDQPPIRFAAPAGYDDRLDHFINFFESLRTSKPIVEDATFGFRAAAPCLACNESYFEKKVIGWDPVNMKQV